MLLTFKSDDAMEMAIYKQIVNHYGMLLPTRSSKATGEAQYVWRMVSFHLSPNPQHQCLPMMAQYYLGIINYQERLLKTIELDKLVDKIINSVPKCDWHGVKAWSNLCH